MGWNPEGWHADGWMPTGWDFEGEGPDPTPPIFSGPIPALQLTLDEAMTPFDTGAYFLGATSYSLTGSLPTGLSFDTNTGIISGTPTVEEIATGLKVTGINADGSTDSNNFAISVEDESVVSDERTWNVPTRSVWQSTWRI